MLYLLLGYLALVVLILRFFYVAGRSDCDYKPTHTDEDVR